ncbi:glycosyltransferase [Candidatus Pelagibacter sp.]|nr:glycosyltransferase [Candidatus Pelagibacter sp.]
MKKIFYWSPYLSNVATIRNVLNSAYSLTKYGKNSFSTYLLDVFGEWSSFKSDILNKKINYIELSKIKINLPISGFLKSRFLSIFIFVLNIFPLLALLKKEKPHYLIIHLLTSIPLTLLFFFNFETKFILRISGLPKLNFFRKFLWKLVSKKIFLITCPSYETLEDIKKSKIFDENKIVVLYDPIINVSLINKKKNFSDINPSKKEYFLSIGRLTKQKNHHLLIDLFFKINDENKDFNLYILGEGEEEKSLKQKIKRYNLEDKVFLLGFKENVYPYIMSSRAIISSSLWEDPGAVMIEAAFCNKIVLSSDCKNGPKEFLMNNKAGYLFENNNLESLFNSWNGLITDSSKKIYQKKILAKKNSRRYSIFNHYLDLKNFLI